MTIYDERNVVVLFRGPGQRIGLSQDMFEFVEDAHKRAQKALSDAAGAVGAAGSDPDSPEYAAARDAQSEVFAEHSLLGETFVIDNPDTDRAPYTFGAVGGSDLKEALQEAIGGFDLSHVGDPRLPEDGGEQGVSSDASLTPQWVASTDKRLAAALADYYSCEIRNIAEVV